MLKGRRFTPAMIVAMIALAVALSGTAVAGTTGLITSAGIANGTIKLADIHSSAKKALKGQSGATGATGAKGDKGDGGPTGATGAKGDKGDKGDPGIANLEADGPYPGATDLGSMPGQGDNSGTMWANDDSRQTSWVQCAPGKVALGGGFNVAADAGDAAAKHIQVVVSEPTQVKDGAVVFERIPDDEAWSIKPNGWMVQGFNTGAKAEIVRPWVICATVNG